MEYTISVRVTLPPAIRKILMREKKRFITQYGSSYKSEPHITLYLGRYTKHGFSKLIRDLQSLSIPPFTVSLLKPTMALEKGLRRRFFFVDVSNKKELYALHVAVLNMTIRYRSSLLRNKDRERLQKGLYGKKECENLSRYGYAHALQLFEPHITLGAMGMNDLQPALADVRKNLSSIKGKGFPVVSITAMLYEKKSGEEKAVLAQEVTIKLHRNREASI